jgi:hypothetical protein
MASPVTATVSAPLKGRQTLAWSCSDTRTAIVKPHSLAVWSFRFPSFRLPDVPLHLRRLLPLQPLG